MKSGTTRIHIPISTVSVQPPSAKNWSAITTTSRPSPVQIHSYSARPLGNTAIRSSRSPEELGYYTIQWSIDSLDWKDVSAQFIVDRILSQAGPGEIVLMHNNGKHTAEALARFLPELKRRGFEIVPISELIYRDNYYIEQHSGLQRP